MRPWLLWASLSAIALGALTAVLLHWWPAMGKEFSAERLSRMHDSPQWSEGRFVNEQPMWTNTRSGLLRVFGSTPGDCAGCSRPRRDRTVARDCVSPPRLDCA